MLDRNTTDLEEPFCYGCIAGSCRKPDAANFPSVSETRSLSHDRSAVPEALPGPQPGAAQRAEPTGQVQCYLVLLHDLLDSPGGEARLPAPLRHGNSSGRVLLVASKLLTTISPDFGSEVDFIF